MLTQMYLGRKEMKTVTDFYKMKADGEKITMLTAYDYPSAKLVSEAGVDMILVGDSLGMVILGYDSTVPVTMDDMVHHGKAVRRGAKDTFVVIDMPFGSYHASISETVKNAVRLMQVAGGNAIKLEGPMLEEITAITRAGIPVVAHLGLTPQSVELLGGYRVQGKTDEAAEKLIEEAKKIVEAGAVALVLECVPAELAKYITDLIKIPTIGIGAGADTDGQVLVFHDMINYTNGFAPKFVKQFGDMHAMASKAFATFIAEVKTSDFPSEEHTYASNLTKLYGGDK